jgi:hypothetical protein
MTTQLLREKIERHLRAEFEKNLPTMVKDRLSDARWIASKETTISARAFAKIDKILARAKDETTVETEPEEEGEIAGFIERRRQNGGAAHV